MKSPKSGKFTHSMSQIRKIYSFNVLNLGLGLVSGPGAGSGSDFRPISAPYGPQGAPRGPKGAQGPPPIIPPIAALWGGP